MSFGRFEKSMGWTGDIDPFGWCTVRGYYGLWRYEMSYVGVLFAFMIQYI